MSKTESETEKTPTPNLNPKQIYKNRLNQNKSKIRKTKLTPPSPEGYLLTRLTHISLNDKLEYNRSTIPFPDDKPPTEDEIKSDKNVKAKIGHLGNEYLQLKSET